MSNYIWDNKIDAVGCPLHADWLRVNVGLTREQCSQINAVEYQGKVYMLTKATRSTSGTDRTMISFEPNIPVGYNSAVDFTVYFNYRKNPIEWREVTLKKTIGMTTVRKTDPNMYKGEERVIEGHAGQETITVEREYKNGKWTGSERNRRSKITIEMVPRQIITGTKEPIEWKPKEEIKYVEITTERMQETDPDIYEDEEKTVPGTRGEIKVTWEEKYEGGKATGETRNRKETVIVEMIPNRIYKGGKHRPVITWEKKEETKYIEITTVNDTDPNLYEDEERIEEGTRGEILVTYEAEYSDGVATGNIRNKKETTKVEMVPKKIIKGTKKRPVHEWREEKKVEYIKITDEVTYDENMYEDEEKVVDGKRGEIITTWLEEYVDGVSNGNKKDFKTEEIPMLPRKITKGLKKHVFEWKKESHKETIEITEKIEYNNKKFQDEDDEIIPGIAGEKIVTYEYEYKDGVKTGNKRNYEEKITIPMVQTRRIKGTRKVLPEDLKVRELFKETLASDSLLTDWRITIDGVKYDSNIFKAYPSLTKTTNRMFGDCVMAQCDFELNDRENKLDVLNKEIMLEKLIMIDGFETWYKFGYFIIKEITSDKSGLSIKCTAYDRAVLFNEKYSTKLKYPAKGADIINEILNKRGVKLKGTFSFSEFEFVNVNFEPNVSEREMIARMAELGGEHAMFNREGELEFRTANKIDVTINGEHRTEYSLEAPDKPIGQVSLGFKDYDDDYIKGENVDGEQTYRIEDNPYAELVRDVIIDDVYNQIHGKQARAFSIKNVIGAEFFDINDIFILNDNQGNKQELTVLSVKTDGSLRGEVAAEKIEYASANYKIAGSIKEDLKRVGLEVNHINQTIKTHASKISEQTQQTSEIFQNMTGIRSEVSEVKKQNEEIEKKQSEIQQNADKLIMEVRSTGGSNLLKNSVLYNDEKKSGTYINWNTTSGSWRAKDDFESLAYGGISGRIIDGRGPLEQIVQVKSNTSYGEIVYYSVGLRVNKSPASQVTISVLDGDNNLYKRIDMPQGKTENYTFIKIEKIKTTNKYLKLKIEASGGDIQLTDLMINVGELCANWTTHISEAVSAGVTVDTEGLKVKNSGYDGDTRIDGRGLAGYYKSSRVFGINKDVTESDKIKVKYEMNMPPIKIISIESGPRAGWSFVPTNKGGN